MKKPRGIIFELPTDLDGVYSYIKSQLGNPDWMVPPDIDAYGNKADEVLRYWIARNLEDLYNIVFDPKEGLRVIEDDVLIALNLAYGHDPFSFYDVEYPRSFSTFFDLSYFKFQ